MAVEPGTFLSLSSVAWSAISSLATVLAVVVALFLPMYVERKKKNNLIKLIEHEIQMNIKFLKKASSKQEVTLNDEKISRLNLMCPILSNIYLNVWNCNKQTVAELSAISYLQFAEIAHSLELIRSYAIEIDNSKGESPYSYMVDDEIERCLQLSKRT